MNHEGHDDHEEDESRASRQHKMHLPSPLTALAEHAMSETIGCAMRVHRQLGPGFLEGACQIVCSVWPVLQGRLLLAPRTNVA